MAEAKQTVVRLSLRWIIVGVLLMLALGFIGGLIGVSFGTPTTPLTPQRDPLVTNVQQVTVSPDSNTQSQVQSAQRSVLLLASGTHEKPNVFATASAVTNDGVLVSVHPPVKEDIFAIDSNGLFVDLDVLGQDAVYGITLYKVRNSVLPALDLASSDPSVGVDVLAISRSPQTTSAIARSFWLQEYDVPPENAPSGWEKLGILHEKSSFLPGTPLLLDDGTVAGFVLNKDGAQVVPVTYVRRSLDRLAAGQREVDPFKNLGFSVTPSFSVASSGNKIEFAFVVDEVTANSPAAQLRKGDKITMVNGQELTWDANLADLLSTSGPVALTARRGERELSVTLTPQNQ